MTLPAPLTPADSDLSDFGFMPLDVGRFRRSDLVTQSGPEAIVAAVLLWGAAWHSKPAASLSNDDRSLAQAAGFGRSVEGFRAIKAEAMHGFIECSDGRLYHPVVAEKAREAWDAKLKRLWRTECARVRKHNERVKKSGDGDELETPSLEAFLAEREASRATSSNVTRDNLPMSHATTPPSHARHDNDAQPVTRDGPASPELEPSPLLTTVHAASHKDERNGMSHATSLNVARDMALDSCARAEKGQGQGQGQGDSTIDISATASISGDDEIEIEVDDRSLLNRLDKLARIAGLNITVPSKLSSQIDILKGWLEEGMDFETMILPTITSRVKDDPSAEIHSLRYFDTAIRKLLRNKFNGVAEPAPFAPAKPKAPIAKQDGSDHRVARFRSQLAYALGEMIYGARFGPGAIAVDVADGKFLEVYFRSEAEVIAIRSGVEQTMHGIARRLELELLTRVVR